MKATPITGTFLDEISHDVPHQNWGPAEWELDFKAMQAIGIDTVILIRSGYKRWLTYPSEVLIKKQGCYRPPIDLVDQFMRLAEKFDIYFYFGTYEWNEIMSGISGAFDIVAFRDRHVDIDKLPIYLEINNKLANHHGLRCWTNCETFDRDIPIKFLPIKWEKLLLKFQAAAQVGVEKGITFEFSHFMSPNSCYLKAGHLYNRYREYFGC